MRWPSFEKARLHNPTVEIRRPEDPSGKELHHSDFRPVFRQGAECARPVQT